MKLLCWDGWWSGGTLAGASAFLKQVHPSVQCFLADCAGSSLFEFVRSDGQSLEPLPGSTVMEGIGINRITANFKQAKVIIVYGAEHLSIHNVLCSARVFGVAGWRRVCVRQGGCGHGLLSVAVRRALLLVVSSQLQQLIRILLPLDYMSRLWVWWFCLQTRGSLCRSFCCPERRRSY